MADQTTLMGLLKTPSQIRKESQERLMQESLARSQQMLTRGGSTALPGIISAYGAQAAQRGTQAGAGLLRGVAGGIGQAVGGDMGQRISALGVPVEERQARAGQEALAGMRSDDPASIRGAAQRLREMGLTGAAMQLDQQARRVELEQDKQTLTDLKIKEAEYNVEQLGKKKPISPSVYSTLVEKHGVENVEKFLTSRNVKDLGPVVKDEKTKALSVWGKKLADQGYIPGTPEFEEQMRVVNLKEQDAIGKSVTVNEMNSMEQKEFLGDAIQSDPNYDAAVQMEAKLSKANSVMPAARKGERPAITLLQRTISDLYNSDTRAASEIDRLVSANKSLTETVTDAGTQFVFAELTPKAISELQTILNNADTLINNTKNSIVENKLTLFNTEIKDENVRSSITQSYGGKVQSAPLPQQQEQPTTRRRYNIETKQFETVGG